MCYVIITSVSLVWFLCTLVADMLLAVALVTPKWLIGPSGSLNGSTLPNPRLPSVGIYTRCKQMHQLGYHCGRFDLDGFGTDDSVYPAEWKAAMFFMSLGFVLLSLTVAATLLTSCRQSACGKSIHNLTACAQVLAGKAENWRWGEERGSFCVSLQESLSWWRCSCILWAGVRSACSVCVAQRQNPFIPLTAA